MGGGGNGCGSGLLGVTSNKLLFVFARMCVQGPYALLMYALLGHKLAINLPRQQMLLVSSRLHLAGVGHEWP